MPETAKEKSKPVVIRRGKQSILIVDGDDPDAELEFDINYQLSLTAEERYEAMDHLVKAGLEMIAQYGYSATPKIITRS